LFSLKFDAERRGRHSHAERGNEKYICRVRPTHRIERQGASYAPHWASGCVLRTAL